LRRPVVARRYHDGGMTPDFDRARACFLEGVTQFEAGDWPAAEHSFLASLQHLPGRVSTRVNLAATRLRLGRPEPALAELEAVLAAEPEHLDAWCHRATALAQLGRDAEALACAEQALSRDETLAAAWLQRGQAVERLRRFDEALAAFERLAALRPDDAQAHFCRGQMLQRLGRLDDALRACDLAVALRANDAATWSQRGTLLHQLGRGGDAAAAFERALELGADADLHHFYLAALGRNHAPPSAPRKYVQALFDDYAGSFDEHLVGTLGYQAHQRLVAALPMLRPLGFDAALDLGCGTGLCAPLLRPLVRQLDGVDLSAPMLERAATLGLYDRLVQAELVQHLEGTGSRYDLVLAADVFIYVGELQALFAAVRRVLRPDGVFCFSVEQALDEQSVVLGAQLRYAHSLPYLRALALQHGLQVLRVLHQPIREQQTQSIPGLYLYLAPA
jgi:predicted TPR repeat methyltransferase